MEVECTAQDDAAPVQEECSKCIVETREAEQVSCVLCLTSTTNSNIQGCLVSTKLFAITINVR